MRPAQPAGRWTSRRGPVLPGRGPPPGGRGAGASSPHRCPRQQRRGLLEHAEDHDHPRRPRAQLRGQSPGALSAHQPASRPAEAEHAGARGDRCVERPPTRSLGYWATRRLLSPASSPGSCPAWPPPGRSYPPPAECGSASWAGRAGSTGGLPPRRPTVFMAADDGVAMSIARCLPLQQADGPDMVAVVVTGSDRRCSTGLRGVRPLSAVADPVAARRATGRATVRCT